MGLGFSPAIARDLPSRMRDSSPHTALGLGVRQTLRGRGRPRHISHPEPCRFTFFPSYLVYAVCFAFDFGNIPVVNNL